MGIVSHLDPPMIRGEASLIIEVLGNVAKLTHTVVGSICLAVELSVACLPGERGDFLGIQKFP